MEPTSAPYRRTPRTENGMKVHHRAGVGDGSVVGVFVTVGVAVGGGSVTVAVGTSVDVGSVVAVVVGVAGTVRVAVGVRSPARGVRVGSTLGVKDGCGVTTGGS